VLTKFAHVESRLSGRKRQREVVFYAPVSLCDRRPCSASVAVGLVLGPARRIWGTNTGENDIYVIDPATQTKVASIEVGPNPQQIAFAYKGMAGPYAYVTVSGSNQIVVLNTDVQNARIIEQIDVGSFQAQRPNGIWASPEGTRLFVANEGSHNLLVIDTGTNEVIATVPVGRKPIRVVASR